MKPLISVIIPAYNIEKYLARTLDSVLAQSYEQLEVIVVNDGSKDGTGAIMDDYARRDGRVRVIHKPNGGVTSARLRGVEEAHGAWIAFVDGDDTIEPDMYQRLMDNAVTYDAQISHCGYQMVFPDGHIDYYHNTGEVLREEGLDGCRDLISGRVEPGLWNKLYRRELVAAVLEKDPVPHDIKINEDVLMNYYLFKEAQHCIFEDFCPYHYVLRRGSAANSQLNIHQLRDPLRVSHIILEDCREELRAAATERVIRQLVTGATMGLDEQPEMVRPYRQECRRELRRRLGEALAKCPCKMKIMALWTAVWPASYSFVHRMYARATGLDKIYDLD